jgi:large subunit ribosomal protein L33
LTRGRLCRISPPSAPGRPAAPERLLAGTLPMAKANTILIKLVSSEDTGYFYVTKKNTRNAQGKLEKKKYDPVARKHVVFRESKIK